MEEEIHKEHVLVHKETLEWISPKPNLLPFLAQNSLKHDLMNISTTHIEKYTKENFYVWKF